jgi:hypothetical protein
MGKPSDRINVWELERDFTIAEIIQNMMKMKNTCPSYKEILVEMWENFTTYKKGMEILTDT